jgi:hypothetical protein
MNRRYRTARSASFQLPKDRPADARTTADADAVALAHSADRTAPVMSRAATARMRPLQEFRGRKHRLHDETAAHRALDLAVIQARARRTVPRGQVTDVVVPSWAISQRARGIGHISARSGN